MDDLNIEKFNPTVAELQALVDGSKGLNVTDFSDKEGLAKIKESRIKIRDARLMITKKGKELRDDAIKFQKLVISKEKELVSIIEGEEERLSGIEEQAKLWQEKQDRIEALPARKQKLEEIKDGIEISDDEILSMNTDDFQTYLNNRVSAKNEKDRLELEKREKEVKDKEEQQKREAEMKDREEKARVQERERLEREARDKELRDADDKKKEEERKAEADRLEKERLEKEESYQKFLSDNGCTEETKNDFSIQRSPTEVKLYKLVAVLEIKK